MVFIKNKHHIWHLVSGCESLVSERFWTVCEIYDRGIRFVFVIDMLAVRKMKSDLLQD